MLLYFGDVFSKAPYTMWDLSKAKSVAKSVFDLSEAGPVAKFLTFATVILFIILLVVAFKAVFNDDSEASGRAIFLTVATIASGLGAGSARYYNR